MFLYNDSERTYRHTYPHDLECGEYDYYCTQCGGVLDFYNTERLDLHQHGQIYRNNNGVASSYVCQFCQELYILVFSTYWRSRYRFVDENTDNLPEPFNQYVVKEGFLCRPDGGKIVYNHANTSMEDKFAFGRGMFNMSTEDIVFGDMDKEWE